MTRLETGPGEKQTTQLRLLPTLQDVVPPSGRLVRSHPGLNYSAAL
jgi:hypothetical protein